ncbi:MAG: helix-turn-helix domain-containing protein [Gemmatimonadota bacterium]
MTNPPPLQRLAWLIADPDQMDMIPLDEIPEIIGVLESVRVRLERRFMAPSLPHQVEPEVSRAPDRQLTAQEAADRAGVTRKWIYNHAESLPFVKKLAPRTYRISERGLKRWLERKAS